jgi:methyltransferase
MTSTGWYAVLLALVAVQRLVEVRLTRRNLRWALERGGFETGQGHYPAMAALHTAFLLSCLAEVVLLDRPFIPALGWPLLGVLVATQAVRIWCIRTLGRQWNTRVVVVPGLRRITGGPYRWLSHPNYVVVVIEIAALPLVHGAWLTAVVFSALNAVLLLRYRIPAEEAALERLVRAEAREGDARAPGAPA